MDDFNYRDGQLWAERVPMADVAEETGTPAYVYSATTLTSHYQRLAAAFSPLAPTICFSVKSLPNLHVARMLAGLGSGFDVVSGGELFRAIQAGGRPDHIVYAGVGKSEREINEAIDAGIALFNCESEGEFETLAWIAAARQVTVRTALRVNPDVDAHTHRYTTTGVKETKFGVDLTRAREFFHRYGRDAWAKLCGVHLHLGSPINRIEPYVEAIRRTLDVIDGLRREGFAIDTIDVGGGFGANYRTDEAPEAAAYAAAIVPLLAGRGLRVFVEPGRCLAANAGVLLTRVEYVKQSGSKRFVIVDAGMNDLIRPALYDAYHFIWPVRPGAKFIPATRGEDVVMPGTSLADVVGPICESGDFLGKDRPLPPVQRGDLLAVFTAGAYGMSMSSQYNSRPRAAEVLVEGDRWRIIRRRETYDDLVVAERV